MGIFRPHDKDERIELKHNYSISELVASLKHINQRRLKLIFFFVIIIYFAIYIYIIVLNAPQTYPDKYAVHLFLIPLILFPIIYISRIQKFIVTNKQIVYGKNIHVKLEDIESMEYKEKAVEIKIKNARNPLNIPYGTSKGKILAILQKYKR